MEIFKKTIERHILFGTKDERETILDYCKKHNLRVIGTGRKPIAKNVYSETDIKVVAEKDVVHKAVKVGMIPQEQLKGSKKINNSKKKQNNTPKEKPLIFNTENNLNLKNKNNKKCIFQNKP